MVYKVSYKIPAVFLTIHEVGKKIIISVVFFHGLRKPRLRDVDRCCFLGSVPQPTSLVTPRDCQCPASLRQVMDLRRFSIPDSRGSCPDCSGLAVPTAEQSLQCHTHCSFSKFGSPGFLPACCMSYPVPPYMPFLNQPESFSVTSKKLDLNQKGLVWV